jgi:hypothetical protein
MGEQTDLLQEGSAFLDQQDAIYGKNQDTSKVVKNSPIENLPPNLGRSISPTFESTIGGANDSHWKVIPLENLPSRGWFYPDGTEITIKAASVLEVRQWSTMDENDRLNVDDTLNFIIERCARIKVKGGKSWMTWRDISELDRLALVFMIHEITFPGNQNSLFVRFTCPGPCAEEKKWSDEVKISSPMLSFIEFPDDVMQFYNPQYRCFVIESAKLNETFYLYMPTIGAVEKLRARISQAKADGNSVDKAFIKIAPYIIQDWQSFTQEAYHKLSRENFAWHINKFTFVTKFVEELEKARRSMVATTCPKCGKLASTPLFSRSGFTIKDLFFISGGLNELI